MPKSAVLLLLLAAPLAAMADDLLVSDAYFREYIPGQPRAVGFMTVANRGDRDCTLVTASAPGIDRLEIHEHSHDNGVMRMRQVPRLAIPAGETLVLRPGGYHLMGFGVSDPLAAGETRPVTLDFGACGSRVEPFAIRDPRRP